MLFRSTRTLATYTARCSQTYTLGSARIAPVRQFHQSQRWSARKGSEDKDSISRDPIEYTRSGTDEEVAKTEEVAFDPNSTDPEEQQKKAASGSGVSQGF